MEFTEDQHRSAQDYSRGWASARCTHAAAEIRLGRANAELAAKLAEAAEVLLMDAEAVVWFHRRQQDQARQWNISQGRVGTGEHS
jgi:hypothetical protein